MTIAKAIVAAARAMPSLVKGDRNAHGKYNYVPIDDYYKDAASVALQHGLTWRIREVSSEIRMAPSSGKDAFRVTYSFAVMHEDGDVIEDFFRVTILHPLQGAQTAGSAMSYADKLFMRTTFHIVTGEQDADASDSGVFDLTAPARSGSAAIGQDMDTLLDLGYVGKPEAELFDIPDGVQELERVPDEFEIAAEMAITFVDLANDLQALEKYWLDNDALFNRMKKEESVLYDKVRKAFTVRKNILKKAI
jgi:hypothetical protein